MNAIEASNLEKTYTGGVRALDGLSFHVESGTIFGLLDRLGLAEVGGRLAKTYSGGMQRRLDIGLGLVHRPKVLFLDEPTTGLDPEVRVEMWREIERLTLEEEMTILLTTHYLEEADRLASRLVIVDRGRVAAEGSPDELKRELRGDTVQVELVESGDGRAAATVRRLAGISDVTVDGRTLRARADNGAAAIPALISTLEHGGLRVAAATIARPSLDDVYLRHTGVRFDKPRRRRWRRDWSARHAPGRAPLHPGAHPHPRLDRHLPGAAGHLVAPLRCAVQAYRRHPRLRGRLLHRVPHTRRSRDARDLLRRLGRNGLHRRHQPRHDGPAARHADLARRAQPRQRRSVRARRRDPERNRDRALARSWCSLRRWRRRHRRACRRGESSRRGVRLALERARRADAAPRNADRSGDDGHAAACVPLLGVDAGSLLPGWIQWLARFNPVDWAAAAGRSATASTTDWGLIATRAGYLALLLVASAALATGAFAAYQRPLILAVGAVVAVLVWSIFRTGQTAIRMETPRRERLD